MWFVFELFVNILIEKGTFGNLYVADESIGDDAFVDVEEFSDLY